MLKGLAATMGKGLHEAKHSRQLGAHHLNELSLFRVSFTSKPMLEGHLDVELREALGKGPHDNHRGFRSRTYTCPS